MKVGIVGLGSMGAMIARGWLESGMVRPEDLAVSTKTEGKAAAFAGRFPGVVATDNAGAARFADTLFLCVRPLQFREVIEGLAPHRKEGQHLVSVNASVPSDRIARVWGSDRVSIFIPTVTAEVRSAVSLVSYGAGVPGDDRAALARLLGDSGIVMEVPESEIGIASELTSCMPGFIACLFGVLSAEGARHVSIPRERVNAMISATIEGTGKLLARTGIGYDELLARVATKGGITEEGAKVIREDFPAVAARIFETTVAKRRLTTARAIESFDGR